MSFWEFRGMQGVPPHMQDDFPIERNWDIFISKLWLKVYVHFTRLDVVTLPDQHKHNQAIIYLFFLNKISSEILNLIIFR